MSAGSRPLRARRWRPAFPRRGRLRAHRRRAAQCDPGRAASWPSRPRDHALRLRRRPRPHQASVDGHGRGRAQRFRGADLRQSALRGPARHHERCAGGPGALRHAACDASRIAPRPSPSRSEKRKAGDVVLLAGKGHETYRFERPDHRFRRPRNGAAGAAIFGYKNMGYEKPEMKFPCERWRARWASVCRPTRMPWSQAGRSIRARCSPGDLFFALRGPIMTGTRTSPRFSKRRGGRGGRGGAGGRPACCAWTTPCARCSNWPRGRGGMAWGRGGGDRQRRQDHHQGRDRGDAGGGNGDGEESRAISTITWACLCPCCAWTRPPASRCSRWA